jgi:hypothetical protein
MRTRLGLKTSLKHQSQSLQSYYTPPEFAPFLYSAEVNNYYAPSLPVVSSDLQPQSLIHFQPTSCPGI